MKRLMIFLLLKAIEVGVLVGGVAVIIGTALLLAYIGQLLPEWTEIIPIIIAGVIVFFGLCAFIAVNWMMASEVVRDKRTDVGLFTKIKDMWRRW